MQAARLIAAFSPLVLLLILMLGLRVSSQRAGALAWMWSVLIAFGLFGGDLFGVAMAASKGLALAIFVGLIIWSSVLLYNVVAVSGGMKSISRQFTILGGSRIQQTLILAWVFSGFLQGVAGFGVPVAVVAPLVAAQGLDPVRAVAATLIGHAWSVTFGSMGSSYFTLELVTHLPATELAHWTALLLAPPIILSGLAVCYIAGGLRGLKEGFWSVAVTGAAMAAVQWTAATHGLPQGAAFFSGLSGLMVLGGLVWAQARLAERVRSLAGLREAAAAGEALASGAEIPGFWAAFAPYGFLVAGMIILQIPSVKAALGPFKLGWRYPAHPTLAGYTVSAERSYAALSLAGHPAPLLLLAAIVAALLFARAGRFSVTSLKRALSDTARQCVPATTTTALLLMMALTMNDLGMTSYLATGVSALAGRFFPLFSGFLGALGCFLTGSNTSSNILLGSLQVEAARRAGASPLVVAAAQTTGGSLGSAIAPAKVLLGLATLSLKDEEAPVFRLALTHTLAILLAVGLIALAIAGR